MNRLQKQCILASTGLHVLLVIALLFGSGFRSKQSKPLDLQPFHMMSSSVVESLLDDPADEAGEREPEQAPIVEPTLDPPQPEKVENIESEPVKIEPRPEPKPEPIIEPKPEPKPEPKKEPAISQRIEKVKPAPVKPKIKISKQIKTNTNRTIPAVKTAQVTSSKKNSPAVKLNQNLLNVGGGSKLKGITTITGSALGQYGLLVQSAYDRHWNQPVSISSRNLTVKVKVVVAPDGSIQSATITQKSGVTAMESSIERAIELVQRISEAPPAGTSLNDRTFILNFNLKS